jgi:hypothetical protein
LEHQCTQHYLWHNNNKTVNLYSKIKIHGWLHLTNSHSHCPSETEGKKLKEQTNARQLLVASWP